MIKHGHVLLSSGWLQAIAALVLAAATAAVVAVSAWSDAEVAARLAIAGVALFAMALEIGSARVVGASTVLVLGGALFASGAAGDPAWVRSMVLGLLWYVAVELAWDAIERRDRSERSSAYNHRRAYEVATVVVVALVVTAIGFAGSTLAPARTLFAQGVIVVGVFVALAFAIRHITETTPQGDEGAG